MEQLISKRRGISIVEVVIATGVFAIFSVGIFYLAVDTLQSNSNIEESNKAMLYAQEGLEAVRQMRDRSYLLLAQGDHGLNFANDTWSFNQAPENIDGYYDRTILISDVFRDANGNIAATGTLDADIKKISATIDWMYKGVIPKSLTLDTYLSDWRGNNFIQTDCAEFNAGTFNNTESIVTNSPPANNCAINLMMNESQSNFVVSADIGEHGNDVFVDGNYVYMSSEKVNEGFAVVDVTDKAHPVVVKKIDVGAKGLSVTKIGNYVYVGVAKNSRGLAVINATTPAEATLVTTKDIGGEGASISSHGNYLYMGTNGPSPEFVVVNVTTPASPSVVYTTDVPGQIFNSDIVGNYAYLGMNYDWQALRIYNISNPAAPTVVSNLGLNEEIHAIKVQGPYAFLGTQADSFYVINIANPASPSVAKKISTAAEIFDMTLQGDYAYVAMNDNANNFAAINISTPTNPYVVYTKDVGGKGLGITSDENYIYESLIVNNKGLVLNGTTQIATSTLGDYISTYFDTGSTDTRYNYIKWVSQPVPGSSVKFQLRTASSVAGLSTATWVGSDGTASTYYENSGTQIVLSPSATGKRYGQYKLIISSDGIHTPLVESVTVDYNP